VITYGAQADNELMRGIAEQTEGKFYNAPNNSGLRTVYADIAAQSYIRLTDVH
jgi:hypothetical protein